MSRLSGVVLIVAGVGVAVYAVIWPQGPAVEASRPVQTDGGISSAQETPKTVVASSPTVQPKAVAPAVAPPVPKAGIADAEPTAAIAPPSKSETKIAPLPAVVTAPVHTEPVAKVGPKLAALQPSVTGGPPLDRQALTRELQRQLKRVGCYDGGINGVWTPIVRKSMKDFTDRVNATLPVEQPDYILLAIVQGHSGLACGRQCPSGQSLAGDGRCLPTGVLAAASKKYLTPATHGPDKTSGFAAKQAPTAPTTNVPAVAPAETSIPSSGRMALAGPKQEQDQQPLKRHAPLQAGVPEKSDARPHRSSPRPRYANNNRIREYRPQAPSRIPSWVPWARPWMSNY